MVLLLHPSSLISRAHQDTCTVSSKVDCVCVKHMLLCCRRPVEHGTLPAWLCSRVCAGACAVASVLTPIVHSFATNEH
eukprot:scaffold96627_cov21-Tisochrysis_lutea.AAC.1